MKPQECQSITQFNLVYYVDYTTESQSVLTDIKFHGNGQNFRAEQTHLYVSSHHFFYFLSATHTERENPSDFIQHGGMKSSPFSQLSPPPREIHEAMWFHPVTYS